MIKKMRQKLLDNRNNYIYNVFVINGLSANYPA